MRTPPNKIDVYVDGAILSLGKENPAITGGWGAIIAEGNMPGESTRFTGGHTPDGIYTSYEAEVLAIERALRDIKKHAYDRDEKPSIVLHTDQKHVADHIEAIRAGKRPIIKESGRVMLKCVEALALEMNVKFEYQKDQKAGRKPLSFGETMMRMAHQLASEKAWTARLEKQGYIHLRGQGRLEGEAALRAITPSWLREEEITPLGRGR